MGKEKSPRRVGEKEALSVGTTIRGSAQKLNLVAALIRAKQSEQGSKFKIPFRDLPETGPVSIGPFMAAVRGLVEKAG